MKIFSFARAVQVACAALILATPTTWADPVGPFVWGPKAPLVPFGVEGAAASVIGDNIYVSHGCCGDSAILRIYTISTDSWAAGPPGSVPRSELAAAAVGGLHYAIGGRPPLPGIGDAVEIFDPGTGIWSAGSPMPTPRAGLCLAVVAGKIHAIGGRDGVSPSSGTPLAAHEVYDPVADSWALAAPLPVAVGDNYACTTLQGKIYVFGGFVPGPVITGATQIYDPATDTWAPGAPMPTPRSNAIAGVLDCHPVAIGGIVAPFGGNTDVVETYHPDTDSWSPGPLKPTPGSEFGASMPGAGTEIFAIGSGIFGAAMATHEALAGGQAGCPCEPLTQGYWHRQCLGTGEIIPGRMGRGPSSPTEPGFVSVLEPCADAKLEDEGFYAITTCDGLDAIPANDPCERALKQLTALILNSCSGRLGDSCPADLAELGCTSTNVADLIDEVSMLIQSGECTTAADCAAAVNEGASGGDGDGLLAATPDDQQTVITRNNVVETELENPRPGFDDFALRYGLPLRVPGAGRSLLVRSELFNTFGVKPGGTQYFLAAAGRSLRYNDRVADSGFGIRGIPVASRKGSQTVWLVSEGRDLKLRLVPVESSPEGQGARYYLLPQPKSPPARAN